MVFFPSPFSPPFFFSLPFFFFSSFLFSSSPPSSPPSFPLFLRFGRPISFFLFLYCLHSSSLFWRAEKAARSSRNRAADPQVVWCCTTTRLTAVNQRAGPSRAWKGRKRASRLARWRETSPRSCAALCRGRGHRGRRHAGKIAINSSCGASRRRRRGGYTYTARQRSACPCAPNRTNGAKKGRDDCAQACEA